MFRLPVLLKFAAQGGVQPPDFMSCRPTTDVRVRVRSTNCGSLSSGPYVRASLWRGRRSMRPAHYGALGLLPRPP